MAPTLIGLFQAGKFLPPQLNLVLELEFAEAADALRPGEGSTDYTIENVRVLASQVTLDSASPPAAPPTTSRWLEPSRSCSALFSNMRCLVVLPQKLEIASQI